MNKAYVFPVLLVSVFLLEGCSEPPGNTVNAQQPEVNRQAKEPVARWYSMQQVMNGARLFQQNCAECHKADASGTANWRQPDATGKYPPPPLNGTAHTWHHHLDGLRRTVRFGGVPLGGSMPAFENKLNSQEIDDVLAWVQSRWPDETYVAWKKLNDQASR